MKTKVIAVFLFKLFIANCICAQDENLNKALITRYVSVLNAAIKTNAIPENEIKRELLLALMLNYFYVKNHNLEISKNYKTITKSLAKRIKNFDVNEEVRNYSNMIKSLEEDSAILRITLDGFDNQTATIILNNSKSNNFDEFLIWSK